MTEAMKRVAAEFGVRPWWVESVAIEYLDCRDYATSNGLWEFKFDRLDEDALRTAVQHHPVVVRALLLHNIHSQNEVDFIHRSTVGSPVVRLGIEAADVVPVGKVSSFWFPTTVRRPTGVDDPKLGFWSHFQVLDEQRVWQWKLAGRGHNGWTSTDVDLSTFNEVPPRLAELLKRFTGLQGHTPATFRDEVAAFYAWVDTVRKPILAKLWELHKQKRAARIDYPKAIDRIPPLLSHMESFTVKNGEFHTLLHAERFYYRSCLSHIRKAQDSVPTHGEWSASKLDRVYQERAEAVIMATACLEALANRLGTQRHPALWEDIERKLGVLEKWHLLLLLAGKAGEFAKDHQPVQTLIRIRDARNELVHFKARPEPVIRDRTGLAKTALQLLLADDFINQLADRMKALIRQLCAAVGEADPDWLEPAPGWLSEEERPLPNAPRIPNPPREPKCYVMKVTASITVKPKQGTAQTGEPEKDSRV